MKKTAAYQFEEFRYACINMFFVIADELGIVKCVEWLQKFVEE